MYHRVYFCDISDSKWLLKPLIHFPLIHFPCIFSSTLDIFSTVTDRQEIFNGCINLHTFFSAVLKGKPSVLLIAYLSFLNWVPLCCHAVYDYLRSKKMLLWCIMSFFPGGLNVCSRYELVWISMIRYQSRDFLNLIVWWSMTINSTSQE